MTTANSRSTGERIAFEEMCKEFEQSHFAAISAGTVAGYRAYLNHLKAFFGGLMLARITTKLVEEYRDHRRQQPSIRYRGRTLKGATVNRELECLTCLLDLAVRRECIPENPATRTVWSLCTMRGFSCRAEDTRFLSA
jgi:Phage integrase SAM-like domain